MLALFLLAETIARPPHPNVPAVAVVRIERAVKVRAEDWSRPSNVQRREVARVEDGRRVVLRLVEHP